MAIYCVFAYSVQMHPCRESIKKQIINFRMSMNRSKENIYENNDNDDDQEPIHQNNENDVGYGSTSSNQIIHTTNNINNKNNGSLNKNNKNNLQNSNSSSSLLIIKNENGKEAEYDEVGDDEEEDYNESEMYDNDADDERSTDSHQIKHINIDILDNLTLPVNTHKDSYNDVDDEKLLNWISVSWLIGSYILSISVDDFGKTLGLVGATSCTILAFILPGYLYVKITRGVTYKRFKAVLLIILGFIIGFIGTISVLTK